MINPWKTHIAYGRVTQLSRSRDNSLTLEVTLANGQKLEQLGFLYHKTLKIGDAVKVRIGFRICGDRYGVEHVETVTPSRVTGRFVETVVSYAYTLGRRVQYLPGERVFIVSGVTIEPINIFRFL